MDAQYSQEIERLYILMYAPMFEYARSNLQNDALAEEAVQETFRIACTRPKALCTSKNPNGWLVNTLKNVLLNKQRSLAAAKRVLTDYISANVSDMIASEDEIKLELAYADIAETEEFKLVKEMVLDGKSLLEMAEEREISVDACRKRLERAKKKLQKILDE